MAQVKVVFFILIMILFVSCNGDNDEVAGNVEENDPYNYIAKMGSQDILISGGEFQVKTNNCGASVSAKETLSRSRSFDIKLEADVSSSLGGEFKGDVLVAGAKVQTAVETSLGIQVGATETVNAERELETPANSIYIVTLQWEEIWDTGNVNIIDNVGKLEGEIPFRILTTLRLSQKAVGELPCSIGLSAVSTKTINTQTSPTETTIPPSPTPILPKTTNTPVPLPTNTSQPLPATSLPMPLGETIQIGLKDYNISIVMISSNGIIYAGTNGQSAGIFKSEDNGNSWKAINNGLGELSINDIDIVPDNPEMVYVVTQKHLWITENGGESWSIVIGRSPYSSKPAEMEAEAVAIASNNGDLMYVGLRVWLLFTIDGGKLWQVSENLNDGSFLSGLGKGDLLISSANSAVVYFQTSSNNFAKSVNSGASWLSVPPVRGYDVLDSSISIYNSDLIYACTEENGVYVTKDGMGSWQPINNGIPNQGNGAVCTVSLASKISESMVYVVIKGNGLYMSDNYGDTWVRLVDGDQLESTSRTGIHINYLVEAVDGDLLIGTTDGVWRLTVDR